MTLWELRQSIESRIQVWHLAVLILIALISGMIGYLKARNW